MRYYAIKVSAGNGGISGDTTQIGGFSPSLLGNMGSLPSNLPTVPGAAVSGAQWCSVVNGQNDPGALNVEFDIWQYGISNGAVTSKVRIWGIPIQLISQAAQFIGCNIEVYGGMFTGLPLATAQAPESGLLISGIVTGATGNWYLTDMTLDLFITPSESPTASASSSNSSTSAPSGQGGIGSDYAASANNTSQQAGSNIQNTLGKPRNIIHNQQANTPASQAIQTALSTAFPGMGIDIAISSNLKRAFQVAGFYGNLTQYAKFLKGFSQSILGYPTTTGYQGITVSSDGKIIKVRDGTTIDGTAQIQIYDLIGQPIWAGQGKIQVPVVMRGDLKLSENVNIPATLVTGGSDQSSSLGAADLGVSTFMTFSGTYPIMTLHHIGNFRNPSGSSWATYIEVTAPVNNNDSPSTNPGSSSGTVANQVASNPNVNSGGINYSINGSNYQVTSSGDVISSAPANQVGTPLQLTGATPGTPVGANSNPDPASLNNSNAPQINLPAAQQSNPDPYNMQIEGVPYDPSIFAPTVNQALIGHH